MTWQQNAACIGAEPTAFDARDVHPNTVWSSIDRIAHEYCSTCPVLAECGELADDERLWGIYGGSYRRVKQGKYVARVIAEGARAPQLNDRRVGVKTGWTAA